MRSNASRASRSGSSKKRAVISGATGGFGRGRLAEQPLHVLGGDVAAHQRKVRDDVREVVEVARPVRVRERGERRGRQRGEQRRGRDRPCVASRQKRSISGGMSSRRARSGGSITAPADSCDSSAASNLPSAARLPSGSRARAHERHVRASRAWAAGTRGPSARPSSTGRSPRNRACLRAPPRAARAGSRRAARRSASAHARRVRRVRRARAATSWPVPGSPRISTGRRAASSCSIARSVSRIGGAACRAPRARCAAAPAPPRS